MNPTHFIKLSHLKVQNANALSSPFTIGFPAMTAWLGFMHALERKLKYQLKADDLDSLEFASVAVISHECNLQTYKGPGDFVSSIIGTGNPLDKEGNRSAFIEEARCHLDVSLLIEYSVAAKDEDGDTDLPEGHPIFSTLREIIPTMKLAGGDILSVDVPQRCTLPANELDGSSKRKLLNSMMPGYALIERRDLMIGAMEEGQDAMDALLDHVAVNNQCVEIETDSEQKKNQFEWKAQRKTSGWVVPIATGFQGISPLGEAKNQRDPDVPHRFAESVVTLGQFVMVNKIGHPEEMLWKHHYDLENNLYLCQQVESKYFTSGE
ncbi:type I-F CRISPR-associated protein Csy2 [Providencia burhodogranariea]|uniref:CRISPR-associated Csy2 family protein n=1 Tax=Providencia burhodogranariea DSM 19968 TaxID=1141662 RepID=K8WQI0_9GAMM|nr:type I-F CRISPR-associated protein Csy2 [Providencia burhodogranariea]EKT62226.1 CRISPR-associated Csy2 family protein [Providencia burhodogranariea DSM 19968]